MGPVSSIGGVTWTPPAPAVKAQTVATGKASNVVSRESAGVSVSLASVGNEGAAQAVYAPSSLPPVDPASEAATAQMPKDGSAPERSGQVPSTPSAPLVQAATAQGPAEGSASQSVEAVEVDSGQVDRQTPSAAAATGANSSAVASASDPTVPADPKANPVSAAGPAQAQPAPKAEPFKGELPPSYQSPTEAALEKQINELLPNLWKASRAAVDVLIGEDAKAAAAARAADFADQAQAAVEASTASDAALAQANAYAVQQDGGKEASQGTRQGLDTTA